MAKADFSKRSEGIENGDTVIANINGKETKCVVVTSDGEIVGVIPVGITTGESIDFRIEDVKFEHHGVDPKLLMIKHVERS